MTTAIASNSTPTKAVAPAIIILGRDDVGKAHASWFPKADVPMAEEAAQTMGMTTLAVSTAELRGAAGRLPKGKLFASGRAFVPFVKMQTFEALAAHLPEDKRKKATAPRPATKRAAETAGKGTGATIERPTPTIPEDFAKIVVGSLVLCTDNPDQGWFLALVVKVTDDGVFTLRWRDWVDYPPFTRKREQLALLHPSYAV